jgi:hypothetical protein
MQESRRSRLRQGALDWQLLHDLYEPERYVEQITDASRRVPGALRRFPVTAAPAGVLLPVASAPRDDRHRQPRTARFA